MANKASSRQESYNFLKFNLFKTSDADIYGITLQYDTHLFSIDVSVNKFCSFVSGIK